MRTEPIRAGDSGRSQKVWECGSEGRDRIHHGRTFAPRRRKDPVRKESVHKRNGAEKAGPET